MTSINPVYAVAPQQQSQKNRTAAPQQQSQKNRTAAHIRNAAVATAGLGAIGFAASKVIKDANMVHSNAIAISNGCKDLRPLTGKLYKSFEKLGQKLFGGNTKIGQAIERYVTGKTKSGGRMASPEQIAALVKKCKTFGALGVVAAPLVLGILGLATYKAGKIDD